MEQRFSSMPSESEPEPLLRRKSFSVGAALGQGFGIFFRRLPAFALMALLAFAPAVLFGLTLDKSDIETGGRFPTELIVLVAVVFLMYMVLAASVTFAVVEEMNGRRPSIGRCFAVGFGRVVPLVLMFLVLLVIAFGFGLAMTVVNYPLTLIHPALAVIWTLVASGWFYSSLYVVIPALVVERGVFRAIGRTFYLTRGNRLRIVAILIILFAVMIVSSLLFIQVVGNGQDPGTGAQIMGIVFSLFWMGMFLANASVMAVSYALLRNDKDGVGVGELATVFD